MTTKLIIDRSRWMRRSSEKDPSGLLLDPSSGKMCCLGFYCKSLGLKEEEISCIGMPADLDKVDLDKSWLIQKDFNDEYYDSDEDICDEFLYRDSLNANLLAGINDNPNFSDEEKERKIKEIFRQNGVEVEFVDNENTGDKNE